MFQTKVVQEIKTHFMNFFFENHAGFEKIWKILYSSAGHMTI